MASPLVIRPDPNRVPQTGNSSPRSPPRASGAGLQTGSASHLPARSPAPSGRALGVRRSGHHRPSAVRSHRHRGHGSASVTSRSKTHAVKAQRAHPPKPVRTHPAKPVSSNQAHPGRAVKAHQAHPAKTPVEARQAHPAKPVKVHKAHPAHPVHPVHPLRGARQGPQDAPGPSRPPGPPNPDTPRQGVRAAPGPPEGVVTASLRTWLDLADRAPVCGAPPEDAACERAVAVARTRSVGPPDGNEAPRMGTPATDRRAHRRPQLAPEPVELLLRQRSRVPCRCDPGLPQDLVGKQVADARDRVWLSSRAFTAVCPEPIRRRNSSRPTSAASGPTWLKSGLSSARPRRRLSRRANRVPSSNSTAKRSQRGFSAGGSSAIRPAIPRCSPSVGPSSVSSHRNFPRRWALVNV